jgi:hypothetical protein
MKIVCPFCDARYTLKGNPGDQHLLCRECRQVIPPEIWTGGNHTELGPDEETDSVDVPEPPARRGSNTNLRSPADSRAEGTPKGRTSLRGGQPAGVPRERSEAAAPARAGRKTKVPVDPDRPSRRTNIHALAKLDAMTAPPTRGSLRWVTLVCLVLSAAVFTGSAVVAAWKLLGS